MTNKFFLERKAHGKYSFFKVKSASGTKLVELQNNGIELFNTRKEAFDKAIDLKRGK